MFGKRTEAKAWMNDLLERNQHPVIWISNRISHLDPAYVRRFTYCLEFPRTPRGVRRAIAHAHLSPTGCPQELIDSTASDPAVTPGMLASAARFSQLAGLSGDDVAHGVDRMLKDMVRALGEKTTNVVPPRSTAYNTRFLNVLGPVTPDAVLGGLKRLGRGRLLLSGPPGTGKTQFAAEIAQQLGRQLVYKTASDINSMWFGESERNVARMFDECDASGEVLFLDEADTLMTSRNNANHRPEVAVTAEFLRQVELFQGVFVCATNFGGEIDAALMRRFEFRLQLLALSVPQRLDLFANVALGWDPEKAGPRPQLAGEVQSALQALDLLTPGDFANVVRRIDSLQLALDVNGWLVELRAEHDTKPGARRSGIGFTA
jgi:SpoVK/Ycf46/Vps4 family AAA+-type ATPase